MNSQSKNLKKTRFTTQRTSCQGFNFRLDRSQVGVDFDFPVELPLAFELRFELGKFALLDCHNAVPFDEALNRLSGLACNGHQLPENLIIEAREVQCYRKR